MELNLEKERRELAECLKLRETLNEPIWGEVEARRKLVHALEQLEQAREAFARYQNSEGCGCCEDEEEHSRAEDDLLKALKQQEVSK